MLLKNLHSITTANEYCVRVRTEPVRQGGKDANYVLNGDLWDNTARFDFVKWSASPDDPDVETFLVLLSLREAQTLRRAMQAKARVPVLLLFTVDGTVIAKSDACRKLAEDERSTKRAIAALGAADAPSSHSCSCRCGALARHRSSSCSARSGSCCLAEHTAQP